jgi:hypothetical protein
MELALPASMTAPVEPDRVESRDRPSTQASSREIEKSPSGSRLHLQWFKRSGDRWPAFDEVDSGQLDQYGVFVIWRSGDAARISSVLYVGRGALGQELARCQRNAVFRDARDLYVTWAKVDDLDMIDSVAAYLYQKLRPLWGEIVLVPPQPVNAPWAA